jgi:hypothetical protein
MLSSFSQSTTTDTSGQTAWIVFGYLTREARNASLYLNYTVPDDFEQFATDDVDLRGANGEDSLTFSQIGELILANKADIQQVTAVVHVFFNIIYIYIIFVGVVVSIIPSSLFIFCLDFRIFCLDFRTYR